LSSLKTREIEKKLLVKGFKEEPGRSRHRFFRLFVEGQKTSVITHTSHGITEYGDSLLGKMSRQLSLTKAELLDLIECRLDGEEYAALMIGRGIVARK
jgi:hypothetical protein